MLADKEPATEAEIDVDALDNEAFEKLKSEMAGEPAKDEAGDASDDKPAVVAEKKEPAPEANTDDDDEPVLDKDGKQQTVPHAKFHQANERRKKAEAEKEALASNYQKLLERTTALLDAAKTVEPEKKDTDEPDPANPLDQINWLVKEVREGRLDKQEAQKRAREEGERQEFASQIKRVEEEFKATTPDYEQALQFAAQTRDEELQLIYPMATAEQRRQFVLQEWQQITAQSLQAGLNPAQRAYEFAVKRGYTKAEAADDADKTDVVTEIAEREETRKAALSLGKTGGGVTSTGAISPEQLLEMDDKEFAAYKAKYGSVARAFAA